MEWLSNLTSGENGSAINLVLITLALAILLIVIVWIFRKMTGTAARRAMRSRVPRLSITDSTTVDEKRYLVMVRRDNIEHLLLIGGANDLVVESNIVRVQSTQKPAQTKPASNSPVSKEATVQETNTQEVAVEKEPSPASAPVTTPLTAGAAAGVVGLSAASSAASNIANATVDTSSEVLENVVETAGSLGDVSVKISESSEHAITSASDAGSNVADTLTATITETVSLDVVPDTKVSEFVETVEISEPVVEDEIIPPTVETATTNEAPEVDLESEISAKLDDALSGEKLDVPAPSDNVGTSEISKVDEDDDMQRLLNELSGEAKETA